MERKTGTVVSNQADKKMEPRKFFVLCLAVCAAALGLAWLFRPTGPPQIPFDGLKQQSIIIDKYQLFPNGDGFDLRGYQLKMMDFSEWVNEQNRGKTKWVRGPFRDQKTQLALQRLGSIYSQENLGEYAPVDKWIKSDKVYVNLMDYEEFSKRNGVHHTKLWVLDSEQSRLFYLWYMS